MNDTQKQNEIIMSIKKRIFELKTMYPGTSLKMTFNVPDGVTLPEKIRGEITVFN